MNVIIKSKTTFNTVEHVCKNIAYDSSTKIFTCTLLDDSVKQYSSDDYYLNILIF